jgi:superfamily II DNA or RNA helicase
MIVLDEARHYVADEWSKLRAAYPDALFLGLDATPERGDGRGLGGMFDILLEATTIKDAVAQGYLVPCDTIRPERALAPGELAQDPVDAYLDDAPGTSAVLFAGSIALAEEYAHRLRDRGVTAAGVFGEMLMSERDRWLAEYERGACKVLCNVAILTEGWDSPRTETVILAGPCGTAGGYLQRVGRGMRLFPGKKEMRLLDLRGVSHTFGDVDEPRSWHLDGKAARRAADDADVRFCPVCGAPSETTACEQCGYSGALKKRKPRVLGLPMDRFPRQHAMTDEQAAKELATLYGVAQRRRFKPYWAERVWSHKFGRPVTLQLRRLAARAGAG